MTRGFSALIITMCMTGGVLFAQSPVPSDRDGLLAGDGMGMALEAESHGYPSPKHCLELKDDLALSKDQVTKIQGIVENVLIGAKLKGEEIVGAEEGVDRGLTSGTVSEKSLRTQLEAVGRLRGELRFIHLQAHIRVKAILSANQLARYNEIRSHEGK
ncbi:MAG TPA: hypothetical protein VMM57_06220 [Bacteroidota bacterium]|nr:hypothetical protein [Bacteroidota bacterium]